MKYDAHCDTAEQIDVSVRNLTSVGITRNDVAVNLLVKRIVPAALKDVRLISSHQIKNVA